MDRSPRVHKAAFLRFDGTSQRYKPVAISLLVHQPAVPLVCEISYATTLGKLRTPTTSFAVCKARDSGRVDV